MAAPLLISSSTNSQFKLWKSLSTSKGIKENNQFFLMGEKLVLEFLKSPAPGFKPEYLVYEGEFDYEGPIKKTQLTKELFKELDVLGTKAPLLLLSFHDFPEKNMQIEPDGLELICPLGDPRNLGALIRSAAAFSVSEIILTKESTHPFLPHAMKASAGAALISRFVFTRGATSELPLVGGNFGLALFGENVVKTKWPKNLRLWVGEEGPGLALTHEQKRLMKFVNIPTQNVESLNAMVSTSIALWEWKKQNS